MVQHEGSSVNPDRQEGPHAHSINLDRANRFALAADLGLDKVLVYRFDSVSGELTPDDPPATDIHPGAGPRHLSFDPTGRYVYLVNELDLTVSVFTYSPADGTLTAIQTTSTLPDSARAGAIEAGYSTAEIQVHPSGKFVYASNRGHDTIAAFGIDETSGRLTPIEYEPTGGRTPRNFRIDPTGSFLIAANQNSDSLVVFRIDQVNGSLTPTGHSARVPKPVCLRFHSSR
jgi:6-phosphogluconolactonase